VHQDAGDARTHIVGLTAEVAVVELARLVVAVNLRLLKPLVLRWLSLVVEKFLFALYHYV